MFAHELTVARYKMPVMEDRELLNMKLDQTRFADSLDVTCERKRI